MGEMAAAADHVGEQDGEGAFVHLHTAPIGHAIQPDILRPVAIRLLYGAEIAEHGLGLVIGARRQQAAGILDEIARPDEVIAAEILIALVEAPGNGEAGDDRARHRIGLVGGEHDSAGAVGIDVGAPLRMVERHERALPVAPALHIGAAQFLEAFLQAAHGTEAGFLRPSAEAQRHQHLAIAGGKVDLGAERDIAGLGAAVALFQLAVAAELLPAIGGADIADRTRLPRHRAGERQRLAAPAGGEQHRRALVLTDPAGVVRPGIDEMRRQQGKQAILRDVADQRLEGHLLDQHLATRIGEDLLLDAPAPVTGGVEQVVGRHAMFEHADLMVGVALFFGEIAVRPGDEKAEIAGAGGVDAGIVDLVENAVAEGEPQPACRRARRAHAHLGARGPACRAAGATGRYQFSIVAHGVTPNSRPLRDDLSNGRTGSVRRACLPVPQRGTCGEFPVRSIAMARVARAAA